MSHTPALPPTVARRGAALAGPTSAVAVLLFLVALAVHGDDVAALSREPLGVTSSVLALVSVGLLLLGLVHLALTRAPLQEGAGLVAVLVAGAGTLLLAGAAWTQLIVVPALAVEAPRLVNEGTGLVIAGYIVSFLCTGLGWLLVGLRLRRDPGLGRGRVRLLLAGSVLMVAPLPTRWVFLAVAVTLLVSARPAPVASAAPVPVTG